MRLLKIAVPFAGGGFLRFNFAGEGNCAKFIFCYPGGGDGTQESSSPYPTQSLTVINKDLNSDGLLSEPFGHEVDEFLNFFRHAPRPGMKCPDGTVRKCFVFKESFQGRIERV